MTVIECDWKYDLSFRAAVTTANASFSIKGYLVSASTNDLLT